MSTAEQQRAWRSRLSGRNLARERKAKRAYYKALVRLSKMRADDFALLHDRERHRVGLPSLYTTPTGPKRRASA